MQQFSIPRVVKKSTQIATEKNSDTITQQLSSRKLDSYTVDSVEDAVKNGGIRVYIKYLGGKEEKIFLKSSLYSNNFKAEAQAAAVHAKHSTDTSSSNAFLLMPCRPSWPNLMTCHPWPPWSPTPPSHLIVDTFPLHYT